MQQKIIKLIALAFLVQVVVLSATYQAEAQAEKASYPAMAPLEQYLMPDANSEIALARSAAPASISDGAEVMVLGPKGYTTAVKGTNGFLCIVERSWGAATDNPEFWNPKVRAPHCFNQAAARSFAPIFLMKTKLVLAGKSKAEIAAATASALDNKGTTRAGAGSDVLHDVEAAVFERRGQELASAPDVFCCGRRSEKLGSRSAGLSDYCGE